MPPSDETAFGDGVLAPAPRPFLAAIVHVDMVSYSRLIALDVTGTLLRLRALRDELIDPLLLRHSGHLAQTGGDSLLLTFGAVTAAVNFAARLQQEIETHTAAAVPQERRIKFRIGIDVGDVLQDGTDLHGNNVNIAARLQVACPPGGLCVSRTVYEHVRDRAPVPLKRLGLLQLKNILHPIEAFIWHPPGPPPAIDAVPQDEVPAYAIVLPDTAAPAGPTIAVLPFRMTPEAPEDAYFADGIVEDIIHMLAAQKEIFVISRGSTLAYSGYDIDRQALARELGVRYLLSGSVRRSADRLRIRTELTDAETGGVIRSDQYDGTPGDVFDVQEDIAIRVAASIAPQVRAQELRRAMRKPPSSLTAYDLVLQALDSLYHLDDAAFTRTHALLSQALAIDPLYGPAHSYLAYWYIFHVGEGRSHDMEADAHAAARAAAAAIDRDSNDALALAIYGHVQAFLLHDFTQAVHYLDRALAAGPNCAMAWTMSSATRGYLDQGTEAVRHAQRGLLLSPLDAHIFWHEGLLAQALYVNGQYDEAVAAARRVARRNPSVIFNLRVLIASLSAAGEIAEARQWASRMQRALPDFRLAEYTPRCPFRGARLQAWIEHLRQAGLRD